MNKRFRFTGFKEAHTPFNPNDPHSVSAELHRKQMVDKLLVALTMNANPDIAAMQYSAVMMGSMTGLAQGLVSHFQGSRKELEEAFLAYAKETFFLGWEHEGNRKAKISTGEQ